MPNRMEVNPAAESVYLKAAAEARTHGILQECETQLSPWGHRALRAIADKTGQPKVWSGLLCRVCSSPSTEIAVAQYGHSLDFKPYRTATCRVCIGDEMPFQRRLLASFGLHTYALRICREFSQRSSIGGPRSTRVRAVSCYYD